LEVEAQTSRGRGKKENYKIVNILFQGFYFVRDRPVPHFRHMPHSWQWACGSGENIVLMETKNG